VASHTLAAHAQESTRVDRLLLLLLSPAPAERHDDQRASNKINNFL
jgi:hypothetical protein